MEAEEEALRCQSQNNLAGLPRPHLAPFETAAHDARPLAEFRPLLECLASDQECRLPWRGFCWPAWSWLLSLFPPGFLVRIGALMTDRLPRNPPCRVIVVAESSVDDEARQPDALVAPSGHLQGVYRRLHALWVAGRKSAGPLLVRILAYWSGCPKKAPKSPLARQVWKDV